LKKRNRVRYRLHRLVRLEGFELEARQRTVFHRYDLKVPESKYLRRLLKDFGYSLQYRI